MTVETETKPEKGESDRGKAFFRLDSESSRLTSGPALSYLQKREERIFKGQRLVRV